MGVALRDKFDVMSACEHVRAFNRTSLLAASDYLVAQAFPPYQPLLGGQAARAILLIDGLWTTQLFREKGGGAAERLLGLYGQNTELYRRALQRLRGLTLQHHADGVYAVAAEILRTLLDPRQPGRQHYSFATKLFHWHAPEHLPIVDSRARRAINELQRACEQSSGRVPSGVSEAGGDVYVREYRRWVTFYSDLIGALTNDDRKRLLDADLESLAPEFRRTNSLLRIIDKVFYYRGNPMGLPPTAADY